MNEKKNELQMSEAFLTSIFLAVSGGFQDACLHIFYKR